MRSSNGEGRCVTLGLRPADASILPLTAVGFGALLQPLAIRVATDARQTTQARPR